jgi:hypothetical protein
VTSYEKILEVFWATHNHCANQYSRQYMTAVFFANEEQKKIAVALGTKEKEKRKQQITTWILPLREFYLAEGYHQKYMLKRFPPLARELAAIYPQEKDFLNSTAVTRVNSYVGGHGTTAQLETEIDTFGLSPQARDLLRNIVKQNGH